ncbi:MAG: type II secretion system major pseudopilin GspG [Gammaproteobacteria bacterium]
MQQLTVLQALSQRERLAKMAGFTLIEIMVVVVIIGILAMVVVPSIISRPDEARIVRARQDVGTLVQALDLYRLDNGFYPSQEQGYEALVTKPASEPIPRNWNPEGYLRTLPTDPWGRSYEYRNPGTHSAIDVYSLGPEGREGSEQEIGNWK